MNNKKEINISLLIITALVVITLVSFVFVKVNESFAQEIINSTSVQTDVIGTLYGGDIIKIYDGDVICYLYFGTLSDSLSCVK